MDRGPIRGGFLWVVLLASLSVAGCANGDAAGRSTPARPVGNTVSPPQAAASLPVRHARTCRAADLDVHFRPKGEGGVDGAGGHLISILDFRNVGGSRCVLSGYPRLVTVSQRGRRSVIATNGSVFPVSASKAMEPGQVTALGVETDSECAARPSGGPAGPMYLRIQITVSGRVVKLVAPRARAFDAGCGVHLTKFTRWN